METALRAHKLWSLSSLHGTPAIAHKPTYSTVVWANPDPVVLKVSSSGVYTLWVPSLMTQELQFAADDVIDFLSYYQTRWTH